MTIPLYETQITIKNYRCFSDSHPVSLNIGSGFTALVGPNNCGKSSFLKLFYELRNIFSYIGPNGNFINLITGKRQNPGNPIGTLDPLEIFCDTNDRPISIELQVYHGPHILASPPYLSYANIVCSRETSPEWAATIRSHPRMAIAENNPNRIEGDRLIVPNCSPVDCSTLFSTTHALASALYLGPFRNILNEGAASYYDLTIGTGFVSTWNSWKAGNNKINNMAAEQVTQDIRRIFGFNRLEINAADGMKTLHIIVDGKPYKLGELGSGITHFIVAYVNAAIRRPSIILIDEPELNLHPSLQLDFLTSLGSYSQHGIIYSTHSIGLARATADRIYSFQRIDDGILCRPFEQTPNYAEFAGEMSFTSFKELGYERILLVEGVTDVRTIQQFLRMYDKDHKVVIIPLGGDQLARGGMDYELGELKRITPHLAAIVDSERTGKGQPVSKRRYDFAESCKKLGIAVCLTELRAIENYFSDQAIKAEWGAKYRSLGPYELLKETPLPWSKAENWRIARRMNKREIEATDIGAFINNL